jgi:hypothetical protein
VSALIEKLLGFGMRRGFERGLLDGERVWLIVGALALLAHLAGREMHRESVVVFSEKLVAGESLEISHEERD